MKLDEVLKENEAWRELVEFAESLSVAAQTCKDALLFVAAERLMRLIVKLGETEVELQER